MVHGILALPCNVFRNQLRDKKRRIPSDVKKTIKAYNFFFNTKNCLVKYFFLDHKQIKMTSYIGTILGIRTVCTTFYIAYAGRE